MKKRFLAIVLTLCMLFTAMPAFAETTLNVERVSGADRYQTAIETSKEAYDQSDAVVLASGENYPDALVGGSLAVQIQAPLILTKSGSLPDGFHEELERLKAEKIYIIGGENTISKELMESLAYRYNPVRLAGDDRQATAMAVYQERRLIASELKEILPLSARHTVNGWDFPDALSAGPLVGRQAASTDDINFLFLAKEAPDTDGVIIGGENSVKGNVNKRIAGADRYATAVEVAKEYVNRFGAFDTVVLVDGTNYPDALSASSLAGAKNAPILLTRPGGLDQATLDYIRSSAKTVYIVGGENSVSSGVITELYYNTDSLYAELKAELQKYSKQDYQTALTGNERADMVTLLLEDREMLELANTFTKEKTDRILAELTLPTGLSELERARAATLLTIVDIKPEDFERFYSAGAYVAQSYIPIFIDAIHGDLPCELSLTGNTSDANILCYLPRAFNQVSLFMENEMLKVGIKGISEGLSTGFNIKKAEYNADYDPTLSLRYGHSSIKHAMQLIGLLRSEQIEAEVWLEPKTSSYTYMLEWGPIPEPSRDYEVVKVRDDLYIANALEYDMVFEFKDKAGKDAFDQLINTYSKKSSANPTGEGMLAGAWWQPLYTSETEMGSGYTPITDNFIEEDGYELHSFTKTEDSSAFQEGYQKIDGDLSIQTKPLWTNDAFYRYLNDEAE